jgi:hypothetical protein
MRCPSSDDHQPSGDASRSGEHVVPKRGAAERRAGKVCASRRWQLGLITIMLPRQSRDFYQLFSIKIYRNNNNVKQGSEDEYLYLQTCTVA